MQSAGSAPCVQARMVRGWMAVVGTALLLSACTASGPLKPGSGMAGAPDAAAHTTHEQRLQALEAGLQQLAQRVEALQLATGTASADARVAERLPGEYKPVAPGIVLASHPLRKVPVSAPADTAPPAPAPAPRQAPGRGDWVINLASYTSQSIAARKQAEFIEAGVDAEQVQTEVKGSTVYRLRVPGFESFSAAGMEAASIRTRLGLNETWIARR